MSKAVVGKWGRNLAIRFPSDIVKAAKLSEGERVEIDKQGDEIVIRPVVPEFSLDELFKGKRPAQWRAEYAGAFEWGPDVGREVIDE